MLALPVVMYVTYTRMIHRSIIILQSRILYSIPTLVIVSGKVILVVTTMVLIYSFYYLTFPTIKTITLLSSTTAMIKNSQSACCKNKTIESYLGLCKDNSNNLLD